MCTRYPIINRVSELKVHIELTRFVQPEKIEIDANERAVNEKSQYCFFVCTTFDSFLNDLFAFRNSVRIPSLIHSSTARLTAFSNLIFCAYFRTFATYMAYSFKIWHCSISSLLCPSFTLNIVTVSSNAGSPVKFSYIWDNFNSCLSADFLVPL